MSAQLCLARSHTHAYTVLLSAYLSDLMLKSRSLGKESRSRLPVEHLCLCNLFKSCVSDESVCFYE